MKQSYIQGFAVLWLMMFYLCVGIQMGVQTGASPNGATELFQLFFQFNVIDTSNLITIAWSLISNLGPILFGIGKLLFLWFPSLWTGIYVWIWFVVCLPLGCAICSSIFFMLRGVHNS